MNKKIVLALGMTLVLGFSGCKKTPTDDIYKEDESQIVTTDDVSVVGELETEGDSVVDQVNETSDEGTDEDKSVGEDVYEIESSAQVVDIAALEVEYVKTASVDDPELKEKMLAFLEPFYFNIYFGMNDYSEAGITDADRILFAVYHYYQYERISDDFNTETFILEVPEERVEELVEKYFGQKMGEHRSFEEQGIEYNGGNYLVPPSDKGWNVERVIDSIKPAGDFAYEVVFSVLDIEGNHQQSFNVMLEILGDRFILTKYDHINAPESYNAEVQDMEETDLEDEGSTSEDSAESTDASDDN